MAEFDNESSNYPVALFKGLAENAPPEVGLGPAPRDFQGLEHTLFGWDGTIIDLSDSMNGIVLLAEEQVGMGSPQHEIYSSTSPVMAGSLHRGVRTLAREVEWVVFVFEETSSEHFLKRNRAFWRIVGNPNRVNVWRVTAPDGSWRELKIRFVEDGSGGYNRDPVEDGWAVYQIRMIAEEPYWEGSEIAKSFKTEAPQDFFVEVPPPMLFISQSVTLDGGRLENFDSDIDAWAKWTLRGPLQDIMIVTTNSEGENPQASLTGSLGLPDGPDGSILIVDTNPRVSTAVLDGVDVSGQVDPWDPRPVPAGGVQTLSVVFAGTGNVLITYRPQYRRAF